MTSQSPLSETATLDYSDSWAAVNRLIRQGESWSGRELNCGLLNLGDGSFVDASNTMGLAFPDDGRNFVALDWDGDGDLDLWVKNRTAPLVRFLRNDGADGHWVRFALRDEGLNRDAIGARVTVRSGSQTLVRERRAGEGFLVQGSSWLHFGLGNSDAVEEVVVTWPDGEKEKFEDVWVGGRFLLQRGHGTAQSIPGTPRELKLTPSVVTPPAPKDEARVVLTRPLAVPELQVLTLDGEQRALRSEVSQLTPMLLTFWASWCPNCIRELRAWSEEAGELERAGVSLLALSVDEDPASATDLWNRLDLPFSGGHSTKEVTALFDLLQQIAVDHRRDMAVPTSFLLDAQGRISVIYRGPVELETVIADVAKIAVPRPAFAGAAFPGRAFGEAQGLRLFDVARRLLDRDAVEQAMFYLDEGERTLGSSRETDKGSLADALMRAGIAFMDKGQLDRSAATMVRATALAGPDDGIIWFAKAKLESVRGDHEQAELDLLRALELDPLFAPGWNMMGSLGILSGDWAKTIEGKLKATELDPSMPDAWSGLGVAYMSTGRFQEAHRSFQKLVNLTPDSADAWAGLGICLVQLGQRDSGVKALERALELEPSNSRAIGVLKAVGAR